MKGVSEVLFYVRTQNLGDSVPFKDAIELDCRPAIELLQETCDKLKRNNVDDKTVFNFRDFVVDNSEFVKREEEDEEDVYFTENTASALPQRETGQNFVIFVPAPSGLIQPRTSSHYGELSLDVWYKDSAGIVWMPFYCDCVVRHISGFDGKSKLLAINAPKLKYDSDLCRLKHDSFDHTSMYVVVRDLGASCLEVRCRAYPDMRVFNKEFTRNIKKTMKLKRKFRELTRESVKISSSF